ncbi:type IV pilin [Halobacteriales archaeon QH_10_67_22]|nr:MAG: type IV pilin [Halobacteriales archaeon QH_10_67_22]
MHERDYNGERGVSPVIGVVLMVAITVVLASTAAAFFIGIGNNSANTEPPTAGFDYKYDTVDGSQVLTLQHRGGDEIDPSNLEVVVSGATCSNPEDPNRRYSPGELANSDSRITAGSTMELEETVLCNSGASSEELDLSEAHVSVTWQNAGGSNARTLWRWRGPQA